LNNIPSKEERGKGRQEDEEEEETCSYNLLVDITLFGVYIPYFL
jgi:hypothetical protein